MRKFVARSEFVPALLLVVAFIGASLHDKNFHDFGYLLDTTSLYAEGALLVLGMTFVIVSGQIDLSVASMMALVACFSAKLLHDHVPILLVAPISLLLGLLLGAINGMLVAYAKLPSFLVTLGTMALYRGLAQAMMASQSIVVPPEFSGIDHQVVAVLHAPIPLTIVFVFSVCAILVLHRTHFGRRVFAVGTNEQAAWYSGVRVAKVRVTIFALSGLMAAVAGLMIDSRLGVARFDHARGLELDVITATVLGGVSVSGGKGSILGAMLAYALVCVVRTTLGLANATAEIQLTIVGVLLIFSVGISTLLEKNGGRLRTKAA